MTPAEIADDLLPRLTLEEKLAMLHQWSPAVPRLGLPPFRTGAEVLHGVAWLGAATVFPQPVGLAASWDPELATRVGAAVADELADKHAEDPSVSRNVWAPVVDPLRHPLWGRNEEGLSEDPHLTAAMATGYARGLRGDDPERWRTVPTLKHLLAYNVEHDRDVISMQVRDRVLHEYELPAFTGPLRAGVAGAVMPGYNLVNGRPAHTSRELIDAVRAAAPEEILVVSDAGAPSNLVTSQAFFPDAPSAHAAALRAGVDSFTDHDSDPSPTIEAVRAALRDGLIAEADVDRAVRRVLITRARVEALTELEPGPSQLTEHLRAHAELAREAAGRAVVLLANDGLLPVTGEPRRIAVLGPLADRVLPDWYAGEPVHTTSVAAAAAQRWPDAEVTVVDGADHVALRLPDGRYLGSDGAAIVPSGRSLAAAARLGVTDWGWGLLTIGDLGSGLLWSADGRGFVRATAQRPHGWVVQESFRCHHDDGGTIALLHVGSGRWLRLDARDRLVAAGRDLAEATRFTVHTLRSGTAAAAAAAAASDLVLCVLGNDPHLLGRETEDRPALELPPSQLSLWHSVHDAAPDAVLVLTSSYPYAFDVEARAVLWSAHSQAVGHGVVDVLAGDVEPSGRLPQTWWRSTADAGALTDYDIIGARSTFWYSAAEPLYAFGHGLTYSTIRYDGLEVAVGADGGVTAEVTLTNTGDRAAVETVQVYTGAVGHRMPFPRRLGGFARVLLQPGEARSVPVQVPRDRFAVWDTARGALTVDPGRYLVLAGPSARDTPLREEILLDGEAHIPHRLPLRAAAFDSAEGIELVAETPERGTAVAGPGSLVLDDVEGLDAPLAVRVARSGAGLARVELQTGDGEGWQTFATAAVPEGTGRYEWTDVEVQPDGPPPSPRGALRVVLAGPARLAAITQSGTTPE